MTELPATDDLRGRVVANTVVQFIAPGVRVAVGVVLVAILGRYLGVAGFGEYGLVVAYVVLLTNVLAEWGLATILVREIARRPEERPSLISSATLLQLVLAGLSYLGVIGIALLSSYSGEVRASLAVFGLTLLLAPVQMLTAHFMTDLRLVRLVAPAVAGTLAQLVLVLVAVALQGPLVAVMAAGAAGVAVEQVWTAAITLRELPLGRPTTRPWKTFLGESWPLAVSTVLSMGARQAPVLVLATFGMGAVGIYAAADKIPTYLARVPYAFRATMFPLLARRWREASGSAELAAVVVAGAVLLTAPLAVVGVLFARDIVTLVFGAAFADAALPFAALMVAFVFVAVGILLEAVLVAAGAQRTNLAIRVAAALVLLALLPLVAPRLGATGAAAAVLASSVAAVLLTLVVIARRGHVRLGRWVDVSRSGGRA